MRTGTQVRQLSGQKKVNIRCKNCKRDSDHKTVSQKQRHLAKFEPRDAGEAVFLQRSFFTELFLQRSGRDHFQFVKKASHKIGEIFLHEPNDLQIILQKLNDLFSLFVKVVGLPTIVAHFLLPSVKLLQVDFHIGKILSRFFPLW